MSEQQREWQDLQAITASAGTQWSPIQTGPEPFVVRHYSGEERPSLKGNGFDGLVVGETREEAEDFVTWLNGQLDLRARQKARQEPTCRWLDRTHRGEYLFVDESGRIVERVKELCGDYLLLNQGEPSWDYVDLESAKLAAETRQQSEPKKNPVGQGSILECEREALRAQVKWVRDVLAELRGYDGPLAEAACPLREWLQDTRTVGEAQGALDRMHAELAEIRQEVKNWKEQAEQLRSFKHYVKTRLAEMGIPAETDIAAWMDTVQMRLAAANRP